MEWRSRVHDFADLQERVHAYEQVTRERNDDNDACRFIRVALRAETVLRPSILDRSGMLRRVRLTLWIGLLGKGARICPW
jgi:hypothetical protein